VCGNAWTALGQSENEHVYYGFVPREVWTLRETRGTDAVVWAIGPETVMRRAFLKLVGNHDGTTVRVYTLPDKGLVDEFSLGKLETASVELPNGTFFRLVSTQPLGVVLIGGVDFERAYGSTSTFIPAVDGGYVGKEFVFMSVQGTQPWQGVVTSHWLNALEDSDVTVWEKDGVKVNQFHVKANEVQRLSLTPHAVFRLVSSGYVMLQAWVMGALYYPAVEGGFVGKTFRGCAGAVEWWQPNMPPAFVTTSLTGSKATVYDTEFRKKYASASIEAGSNLTMQVKALTIALETEHPVMLMMHNTGLTYTGLRAGQEALVFIPTGGPTTGEAYLFALKRTDLTLDDMRISLAPDGVFPLQPGLHKIAASENVVIEVMDWPSPEWPGQAYGGVHGAGSGRAFPTNLRLTGFCTYVPSVQSLDITREELRLRPVVEEGIPWLYLLAAAIPVALVAVWWLKRTRK